MPKRLAPITDEDRIQGEADAPLALVEYGDFQCPHSRVAYTLVKRLQRKFGARLRFVYRNFPLTGIHPLAEPAAEAAEFAAVHDRYSPMYDAIFDHQASLAPEMLVAEAARLGLNPEQAERAMEDQAFSERIERDPASGEEVGVHGTPTFFINGVHYTGAWDYDELSQALQNA
ncbi:MAG: DsbA family protein [Acidobacteriota bacterium]|nr:DsbA family protein [Acidobacteriota bacterium]